VVEVDPASAFEVPAGQLVHAPQLMEHSYPSLVSATAVQSLYWPTRHEVLQV